MAWGKGGEDRASCSSLIERVRRNEIIDLTILPGKRFESKDLISLAEIFKTSDGNNRCRSIQASGHSVTNEALRIFGAAMCHSALEYLAVGDSSMGNEGIQALAKGIQEGTEACVSLKQLDLSFKGMTWDGLIALCTIVDKLPSLDVLDLARNQLGSSEEPTKLPAFFPAATEINLNDCDLDVVSLKHIVSHTTGCRILHLSNNERLQQCLFDVVSSLPLQQIDTSNCGLSDLSDVPQMQIKILDVSENRLTVDSIRALRERMPHLVELTVASNPTIGVDGVIAIAQMEDLTTLDASATNCGVDGALALIRQCMRLTSIRLFDNKLGQQGFQAIADSLRNREGHRIFTLDVAGNGANEEAVANLIEAAAPCVDCLVVGGNKGGPKVEEAIQKAKELYPKFDVARDVLRRGMP